MADAKFIQIHTLTSYPGALLNRDDAGFAKRLPFGGATRTRVSSQCLKYHWRNYNGEHALSSLTGVSRSIRSRETFKEKIARPIIGEGYPPALAACAVLTLRDLILSDKMPNEDRYKAILQGEEAWEVISFAG